MKKAGYILFCLMLLLVVSPDCFAQARRIAQRRNEGQKFGTLTIREKEAPDSLELARRDSLRILDSLHRADSVALLGKSSLDMPAFSAAKDSIVEDFSNGKRLIYYYGDVTVKYQDMELTAGYMEYDMKLGEVFAKGVYDSLTMAWTGQPVMTQGSKTYNMEQVRYNFNSKKAMIKNMDTTEDEGILHGENIKMMDDNSINMTKGRYTLCDADDPHYYLKMSMGKIITKPTQKTVFGPANLVVEGVNIPFIGIPFGFVPKRPERATGLLMPTFGEEEARGFYMRDLGMYFVFGDHFDLSVTGDYYTLGSWAVDINSRYKVNYKFSGSLSANYSYDKTEGSSSNDYNISTNFGLRWSHTQDSKAHPGTSFSASVNFSTPSNNRYNSRSINEALQNQVSSSISYGRNWNGKVNLSINALHSQSSRDSSYTFTLPNVTFSISTFYPFKKKNRVGKEGLLEKVSFSYNTSLQNKISFKAKEFNPSSPEFLNKFQNGMTHNFSIGLPSFQLFKYINISPSVSYGQNWFFKQTTYEYDAQQDRVVKVEGNQFSTLGITHNYAGSVSMSTRLYGMFNFGTHHKIQAIRHVISPSASISYTPDRETAFNGYRTLEYVDKNGKPQSYRYNLYEGQLGGVPSGRQAASASFSIGNNIEAKVRDFADTTGNGTKKVKIIDQLSFNGSYNFMADSLKMSNISMSMSTTLFNKVSISGSANFDPYAIDGKGNRYNRYAITAGQGLLRLRNASVSASYAISGKGSLNGFDGTKNSGGGSQVSATSLYQRVYTHPVTGEYIPGGWLYYTNPNVPWSLNFSASFGYTSNDIYDKQLEQLIKKNNFTATLQVNGTLRLSPRMNMTASSGYDFIAKQISTTQVSFTYDMHCFNISVQWVPTGFYKSYSFRIAANAAALADLLQFKKSSSYWDN